MIFKSCMSALVFLMFSFGANAEYPIESSKDLVVTSVSCATSDLDTNYHLQVGDSIGMEMFILETKLQHANNLPVGLKFNALNDQWEYTIQYTDRFKDGFPCVDVSDTLIVTLK